MGVDVPMWKGPAVELFELSWPALSKGLLAIDGREFRRSPTIDLSRWLRAREEWCF